MENNEKVTIEETTKELTKMEKFKNKAKAVKAKAWEHRGKIGAAVGTLFGIGATALIMHGSKSDDSNIPEETSSNDEIPEDYIPSEECLEAMREERDALNESIEYWEAQKDDASESEEVTEES